MVLKIDMIEVTSSAHCNTPEKAEVLLAVWARSASTFKVYVLNLDRVLTCFGDLRDTL